jgi:hypothetical protein
LESTGFQSVSPSCRPPWTAEMIRMSGQACITAFIRPYIQAMVKPARRLGTQSRMAVWKAVSVTFSQVDHREGGQPAHRERAEHVRPGVADQRDGHRVDGTDAQRQQERRDHGDGGAESSDPLEERGEHPAEGQHQEELVVAELLDTTPERDEGPRTVRDPVQQERRPDDVQDENGVPYSLRPATASVSHGVW